MNHVDDTTTPAVGYTCAYTPLPLLEAAGFVPCRLLPVGDAPDAAGEVLHENLCPHVKRIVDRVLADDLPEQLSGFVFVNSCDAMRRLYDVWRRLRPQVPAVLIDLPVNADQAGIAYFAAELQQLVEVLDQWSGSPMTQAAIETALAEHRQRADEIAALKAGGVDAALLKFFNEASAICARDGVAAARRLADRTTSGSANAVPLYLFGNVLFTPELLTLIHECGADVVGEDLCSGSRPFGLLSSSSSSLTELAAALLARQPCARTLCEQRPGRLAQRTAEAAVGCGARGAILHTVKFCDPYATRLPAFRRAFDETHLPLLMLEGDCTTRSIEQQRTRVEAFVEMLSAQTTERGR